MSAGTCKGNHGVGDPCNRINVLWLCHAGGDNTLGAVRGCPYKHLGTLLHTTAQEPANISRDEFPPNTSLAGPCTYAYTTFSCTGLLGFYFATILHDPCIPPQLASVVPLTADAQSDSQHSQSLSRLGMLRLHGIRCPTSAHSNWTRLCRR